MDAKLISREIPWDFEPLAKNHRELKSQTQAAYLSSLDPHAVDAVVVGITYGARVKIVCVPDLDDVR